MCLISCWTSSLYPPPVTPHLNCLCFCFAFFHPHTWFSFTPSFTVSHLGVSLRLSLYQLFRLFSPLLYISPSHPVFAQLSLCITASRHLRHFPLRLFRFPLSFFLGIPVSQLLLSLSLRLPFCPFLPCLSPCHHSSSS